MTKKKIYFVGIAGTGMASVAGLAKELDFDVIGSDQEIYPPMSTMLEKLEIPVLTPYNEQNIISSRPDVVIIANALSRGNVELEYVLKNNLSYTSFPAWMGDEVLSKKHSIVVSGTHGKTTTCSLLTHCLNELGEQPGFLIGGIPRNFPQSFAPGKGKAFVIEGDEYDTAFFDKGPKFLHYKPKMLLINNIEFDHADIYQSVEQIEEQFKKLIAIVNDKTQIIANIDDAGVFRVVEGLKLNKEVTLVATKNQYKNSNIRLVSAKANSASKAEALSWELVIRDGTNEIVLNSPLVGDHNAANITMVYSALKTLSQKQLIKELSTSQFQKAINSFKGVRRRMELLGKGKGIEVFEDFAHHPTAITTVIDGVRKSFPDRRLLVAFEPRNASSRRNIFQNDFAKALSRADRVFIGKCPIDQRIPVEQRMNTNAMSTSIGSKAKAFEDNELLYDELKNSLTSGDVVVFMSSSSFSGIQHRLAKDLESF